MLTGPPETQAFKTVRTVHPQPAGAGTGSGVPLPAGWGSSPPVHFHCLLSPSSGHLVELPNWYLPKRLSSSTNPVD